MKKIFLKYIKEKSKIEDIFLVAKKEMGMSKSGKPYLNIKLMDKTGEMEARVWDDAEDLSKKFGRNDFVKVKGAAIAYQGGLQLNVSEITKIDEDGVAVRDFLPASDRGPDEMMSELESIVAGMKNNCIRKLASAFLEDEEIRNLLKLAPAAKSMHHPYLGGLLEHILSLCGLVHGVAKHYQNIDKDLLLAGAILHDIGKIYELRFERAFDYSDEGRLLGHITIGIGMIDKKLESLPDFPKETALLLKHMLLSHHGHLDFGSPKRPKTVEAVILYYLDDMDSKVQSMQALIEKEKEIDSKWTSYHKMYERYIYKGKYLSPQALSGDRDEKKPMAAAENSETELELFKK
ncbi:MAG: HD domain-containing protein [Deltaproteobacteria bacterium]|nr:HD domain-containing protein [Deltaproteobacteria bacterium]